MQLPTNLTSFCAPNQTEDRPYCNVALAISAEGEVAGAGQQPIAVCCACRKLTAGFKSAGGHAMVIGPSSHSRCARHRCALCRWDKRPSAARPSIATLCRLWAGGAACAAARTHLRCARSRSALRQ